MLNSYRFETMVKDKCLIVFVMGNRNADQANLELSEKGFGLSTASTYRIALMHSEVAFTFDRDGVKILKNRLGPENLHEVYELITEWVKISA